MGMTEVESKCLCSREPPTFLFYYPQSSLYPMHLYPHVKFWDISVKYHGFLLCDPLTTNLAVLLECQCFVNRYSMF